MDILNENDEFQLPSNFIKYIKVLSYLLPSYITPFLNVMTSINHDRTFNQ